MEEELGGVEFYKPESLAEFEPEERYNRRYWNDNLHLSFDVVHMKKSYGGRFGNVDII